MSSFSSVHINSFMQLSKYLPTHLPGRHQGQVTRPWASGVHKLIHLHPILWLQESTRDKRSQLQTFEWGRHFTYHGGGKRNIVNEGRCDGWHPNNQEYSNQQLILFINLLHPRHKQGEHVLLLWRQLTLISCTVLSPMNFIKPSSAST